MKNLWENNGFLFLLVNNLLNGIYKVQFEYFYRVYIFEGKIT